MFADRMKRIIGKYTQNIPGPLLIVICQMHGNEPAGKKALDYMFKMLEVEPITNPDFIFKGTIVGMVGNLAASKRKVRYLEKDLNRQWTKSNVNRILATEKSVLHGEDLEVRELYKTIKKEIVKSKADQVYILDLHTTSSFGGIFTIPSDNDESVTVAAELHAPVIKGMLNGIEGTLMHYFNTENIGTETMTIAFESGQHEEPLSVNRAIAAITNFMRSTGCVDAAHIENRHDQILQEFSKDLPKVCNLMSKYTVKDNSVFELLPGFKNFQKISKGQLLGKDASGELYAPSDGLILMPRYQSQGDDGYFIIQESSE